MFKICVNGERPILVFDLVVQVFLSFFFFFFWEERDIKRKQKYTFVHVFNKQSLLQVVK